MRRRPAPATAEAPVATVAAVRAILEEANRCREAGENMHHHPVLERLAEVSGNLLAVYVFVCIPGDMKLDAAKLDAMAESLPRYHPEERTTMTKPKRPQPAPQMPPAAQAPPEVPSVVDLLGRVGKE